MWFWIWFAGLGLFAGAKYKQHLRPLVRKASIKSTKGSVIPAVVLTLYFLMMGRHGNSPVITYGIAAAGMWLLICVAIEAARLKREEASRIKQPDLNQKVAEFYRKSQQQAKRIPAQPTAHQTPPPPVIKQYTAQATENPLQDSLDVGAQVPQADEQASAQHAARQRLVHALLRRPHQTPDAKPTPEPSRLFSQPRPNMVPVKLLPDRQLHVPMAAHSSQVAPVRSVAPAVPVGPVESKPGGFTYQPQLIESRFGSKQPVLTPEDQQPTA